QAEPEKERQQRGHATGGVQPGRAAAPGDGQQPGVDDQQKSEQDRDLRAVVRNDRQVERQEQRQVRGGGGAAPKARRAPGALRQPERARPDDRKGGEDPGRGEQTRAGEGLQHPRPLEDRGEQEARQERQPALPDGGPRHDRVERQQVGKQQDGLRHRRQQRG